jgi:hypothetical protein
MWDFVVDKVALGQVFSEYFGFPCQSSFHHLLHNHPHLSSGACTISQKWSQYLVDLVPCHKIKKNRNLGSVIYACSSSLPQHVAPLDFTIFYCSLPLPIAQNLIQNLPVATPWMKVRKSRLISFKIAFTCFQITSHCNIFIGAWWHTVSPTTKTFFLKICSTCFERAVEPKSDKVITQKVTYHFVR